MILFGQTLLDLASYLSVEPTSLVPMVTARGIGYGVGTVAAGLTFDRFRNFSFWQLTAIISVLMLCQLVTSTMVHTCMHAIPMLLR